MKSADSLRDVKERPFKAERRSVGDIVPFPSEPTGEKPVAGAPVTAYASAEFVRNHGWYRGASCQRCPVPHYQRDGAFLLCKS